MMKLNENYNREQFIQFIDSFLPDFDKDIRSVDVGSLKSLEKASYLGKSKKFDIQVFELTHQVTPKSRIVLATDGFRVMRDSASFQALVSFYNPKIDEWRLSLMTATPEINQKGKVSTVLSNPRRYSFALGSKAKINTPYNFLIKKGKVETFEELKERFSVEVVNKEFYKEIAELYTELVGGIRGKGRTKKEYPGLIKLPAVAKDSEVNHDFAVRLIGRIIFCWFLREKKSKDNIPLIPHEILSLHSVKNKNDYYHNVLEPLFFEILNKPVKSRKDKYTKKPYDMVPYLNGGLFTPQLDDCYSSNEGKQAINNNMVVIPDKWLNSLFEVLELYNFTIDENTTVDIDLSIDPEMLGRIFENLLAEINPETGETIRKSTGSYYTPREIVNYMIDESLLCYLRSETGVSDEKLRSLITYDLDDGLEYPVSNSDKPELIDALNKLKLLDPACGSGAFPIGALQKILYILQIIDPEGKLWFEQQITNVPPEIKRVIEREFKDKNLDYVRKLGIIRNSIFGIDIQPVATEISRLRCFLTLIVDELVRDDEENRGIEPLPNLDFKFVTANSLIRLNGLQREKQQLGLYEDTEGISELKELRDMFFSASGHDRDQLKLQFVQTQNKMFKRLITEGRRGYAELTTQLTTWEPFTNKASSWFDSEWMFGIKDGFDLVITNPPYGLINKRQNKSTGPQVTKADLAYLKKNSVFEHAFGGMLNIFRLFICLSLNFVKEGGHTSLIFPMAFMGDVSSSNLRKYILENHKVNYLEAFPERDNKKKRVFEAVKMSVCVLGVSKHLDDKAIVPLRIHKDKFVDLKNKTVQIPKITLKKNDPDYNAIPLVNKNELKLLSKIRDKSIRLKDIGKCYTGEIDLTIDKKYLTDNPEDAVLIKGAQVQRYMLLESISQGEIMYLNSDFYHRNTNSKRSEHHKLERIIMQGITGINEKVRLKMTLIKPPTYCANSVNYLAINNKNYKMKFILGIFNSSLVNWCFKTLSTNSNVNGYEVDNLPIPKFSEKNQDEISNIVDGLLNGKDVNEGHRRIDNIIYQIYGLTDNEIGVIKKNA